MDQGVIKNSKLHYQKTFLKKIVSTIENNQSVPDNIIDLRDISPSQQKSWRTMYEIQQASIVSANPD